MNINSIGNTITLLGRIADTQKPRRPILPDAVSKPACRITPIRQPLRRARPEEVGLDSAKIAAFLKELAQDETLNMHSILIVKDGAIVTEATFGEHSLHSWKQTYSACKSITSLAVGMLVDDGLLAVTEKLTELFDDKLTPLTRLAIKDLTVRHLLTMTTGASFNEASMLTERDWIKGYLGGTFAPGEFAYNSLNSYMLSAIVQKKTGKRLSEFLADRLFAPLGIEETYWESCPLGIDKGGWGMFMRPEDMAKIGLLVMQDGVWNEKRILSAEWLREATRTHVSAAAVSKLYDYGYHIWTGHTRPSFLFNGMFGQNVLGLRDSGVLLVTNAGNNELYQSSNYFTAAERYFASAPAPALPTNDTAYAALQHVIFSLKEHAPAAKRMKKKPFLQRFIKKEPPASAPSPLPPECERLSGMRFESTDPNAPSVNLMPMVLQVVQNNYGSGFSSVSFLKSTNAFYMTYTEAEASYLLPIGFDRSADAELTFGGVPYHVKTRGSFVHDEDGRPILKIRISFEETPLTRYIKIYYAGISPRLKQYETPGGEFVFSHMLSMKHSLPLSRIVSDTIDKIDTDYVRYRVFKVFSPEISLTRCETKKDLP